MSDQIPNGALDRRELLGAAAVAVGGFAAAEAFAAEPIAGVDDKFTSIKIASVRGIPVGAKAYIVKGEFDQTELLESIRMLVGGR